MLVASVLVTVVLAVAVAIVAVIVLTRRLDAPSATRSSRRTPRRRRATWRPVVTSVARSSRGTMGAVSS